jgi:hypothetical protein
MTLRDYFAAKIVASLIIEFASHNSYSRDGVSDEAYLIADEMLKRREVSK